MPSLSSRIEVRLEPTGQDTVRLVLDDVHASGTRVLFTSAELPLKDVLEGTFSPDFAALVGENLLPRLAALVSSP
jgi:hypothetical protein